MSVYVIDWYKYKDYYLVILKDSGRVRFEVVDNVNCFDNCCLNCNSDFIARFSMLSNNNEMLLLNLRNGYVSLYLFNNVFQLHIIGYNMLNTGLRLFSIQNGVGIHISNSLAEVLIQNKNALKGFLRYIELPDGRSLFDEL